MRIALTVSEVFVDYRPLEIPYVHYHERGNVKYNLDEKHINKQYLI